MFAFTHSETEFLVSGDKTCIPKISKNNAFVVVGDGKGGGAYNACVCDELSQVKMN